MALSLGICQHCVMAIFARRAIQARLSEAGAVYSHLQLRLLVQRLNSSDKQAIEAEWELMWLTSLSRVGGVRHEATRAGASRFPDVTFQHGEIEFVADIGCASDLGSEEANPVRELRREMHRLFNRHAPRGGLTLMIQSGTAGPLGDQRVRLAIPERKDFPAFCRQFIPFLQCVAQHPSDAAYHSAEVKGGGVVTVKYDPARRPRNDDSGHLSFDVAYSLTRNPVANVLKSKHAQLKKCAYRGTMGVILCDADCSTMTTRMSSARAYTLDAIVYDFLRQNSSIGFVLTVGLTQDFVPNAGRQSPQFVPKLFCSDRIPECRRDPLREVFDRALSEFPQPKRTALGARYALERGQPPCIKQSDFYCWSSFTFGRPMDPIEIKLSARTLLSLLGGTIDLKEFREAHCIKGNTGQPPIEPLRRAVHEGRRLESVMLQEIPGEDDDLVVLQFGPLDPAAVRFKMPDKV